MVETGSAELEEEEPELLDALVFELPQPLSEKSAMMTIAMTAITEIAILFHGLMLTAATSVLALATSAGVLRFIETPPLL